MADKKEIEVFVKQDATVKLNGKPIKVKKGKQALSKGIADILIKAGYAEKI